MTERTFSISSPLHDISGLAHFYLDDAWGVDTALRNFWASLFDIFHPSLVTVFFPFLLLMTTYFVPCGIMYLLENAVQWPWLLKYKIQKKKTNSKELNLKCLNQLLWNYFVVIFPLYSVSFSFMGLLGFEQSPETIPSWWILLLHEGFFLFMEDFVHYWLHRLLHIEWLYKNIHAVHHEFTAPSAMAATYAHPMEIFILGFATFSGPFILRCHVVSLFIWVNVRQLAALETHSGFDFSFSLSRFLPFYGGSELHDFHHKTYNGAFSSNFIWWDTIFKTDGGFYAAKAREARRRKKQDALKDMTKGNASIS